MLNVLQHPLITNMYKNILNYKMSCVTKQSLYRKHIMTKIMFYRMLLVSDISAKSKGLGVQAFAK